MTITWCNGYRRRKWTRRHEFKSWTRLIAFHIALIPLGKVWIQLFSLELWVNSRTDWVLQPWLDNKSRKTEFKPVKLHLKKLDLVSYPARAEGLGKYDYLFFHGYCYTLFILHSSSYTRTILHSSGHKHTYQHILMNHSLYEMLLRSS